MLFTGDAETEQREWLIEHHPDLLDADVLKASHHGSHNGAYGDHSGVSWIQVVDPADIVISVSDDNTYGHPHDSTMDTYEDWVGRHDVHCTSRHGTIRIYGYQTGWHRIYRQTPTGASCRR